MRCVLDTNLLVSGIISAGTPRQLLRRALAGEFTLFTSEILLAELMDIPIVTASEAIQRLDLESRQ